MSISLETAEDLMVEMRKSTNGAASAADDYQRSVTRDNLEAVESSLKEVVDIANRLQEWHQ